ncbi:MAG: cupin domain-containing protein [Candidatus Nanopelagicales bacterium]
MSTGLEGGPGDRSALARCIRIEPAEFAESYWGSRPLLSRAADLGGDFSDLFSAAAVDELVADRALRTPFARMAKEGVLLAPSRYTSSGGSGAEIGDQLAPEQVLAELAAGSTLVLQGLHRTWLPLAEFTRALVADLGHPCQVNAYITPASSRGFDPHYDVHDVFVLQIHGEKHWTIHEPVHPDPLRSQPWSQRSAQVAARAEQDPVIDATFRPGDALYLPRGWIHSATALGGTSIHLTIGIPTYTRHDIVERAVALVAQTSADADAAALRGSLPLGAGRANADALRPSVQATIDALIDALHRIGSDQDLAERMAADLAVRFAADTRPERVRPLATLDALADLSASTSVALRDGLAARIEEMGEQVAVLVLGKRIMLPCEARPALESAISGPPVRVGELPGLDTESARVVVRRLLREGVLVVRQ